MIKKAKKFIPLFLIGSLLAEDNGWYMSVGYQIGGTQQFINNKQLLANENIINSVTQSAINIAGPTTGLITLSSQSVIDALGYGVSNTVGNQLEGISNILNQIGKRKDFYSSRQISSISQQIIGLKGSSDPLKAHSSQITAKLLSNTQSAFDQGIALSSSIISSVNSLNPSNNTKEVKAQLQNTVQSMAELLQQIEHSITKTTSTTYAQSLLTNLTDAVNASSNNTAYVSALVNALNTLGVGVFPTTTTTHVVLNPPGQIVFYPANSILGSTSSNSNNQQQYNNTLLMNTLQGTLSNSANGSQNNPNGCANQVQCLEQFIQNLNPLTATPTSNNQANQQVQAIAQKLQSIAINALDNNAINNTTYNLNNLHNALNFQAYESTIEQYNNALKQISWISFSEPKNLLKNTSNNYQIGTVTNAQGQNISAYDCMTATGSLSSNASSGISCSATSSTSSTNGSTNSFDNSLVATSKVQTINGKEQIGVNSFNLVSQVWSVYNSLKTSEANLQKNAKILCANGSSSGTSSCGNSGGLSISGNAQLQNILSSTNGTSATAQAKSNAPKLKAMVVVNNEEEAKTTNLAQSSGTATQSPNSTVMGALNTVLQNVNNFQQSIQSAFQSQSSNIQAWANALYNTSNPNGNQSQNLTASNNQDLRIQLRANFYQLINTIDQQVPTDMNALIAQSQQTQQTSGATNNNNACAGGTNGSSGNWCYQQWSDSKAYYSGLQSALGYTTSATTQSGSSGGNSITYNVQQITLTSNGLLNQIITNLKGVNGNGGNNGGSSGGGNGTSQITTAYQMLTDASDGKLGTYTNNAYQTCTNGANGNSSNCYTPNKQQSTTTANTATATDSNLQKVYNDAQKIADIIASSGNNKGVENGLKQFFEALKSNSSSLSNLCNGSSGNSGTSATCSGGLINLLGAIPANGVSDTNNLIHLLTEFIKTAGFIQNNDSNVSTSLTSAFQAITSAISQGFQALQNDISPNAILTLLQEITSNTTTIQSFSQTLRQLLGDKTFFMVQQKLIDAMINARNQVQNAQNQANNYGSQPILSQYAAAKSTQHGMSNGLGVGIGYKYFFGKARKLGLRHYFFFDYGFSEIGLANQSVKANIFAYGVGTDFLWNLFRRTYNTKALNFGLFAGVQLGGATWLSSLRQQIIDNWGNANDIHSTNFQVALNFGVRTNFAEFKRFAKKFHNQGVISQKSVEFGIKVPLINQAYLSSAGADVSYRRLYTFYINYIMGF
ncbi:Hop family outer membrane protein HopL [Helicobacter pylori]